MAKKDSTPKLLGINKIAAQEGLRPEYVRMAIRQGKLETQLLPRSEGSKTLKHFATPEAVRAWRDSIKGTRTSRADGRNKYFFYATPEEHEKSVKLLTDNGIEAIIKRANVKKVKPEAEAAPAS